MTKRMHQQKPRTEKTPSAIRIGERIRTIRTAKGITQKELGEKVGLSADRIQKYENGARKPGSDNLEWIASELDVSLFALTDPVVDGPIEAMYVLFELVSKFDMKIEEIEDKSNPRMCISVDQKSELYDYMREWYQRYQILLAEEQFEKEAALFAYQQWKWTFPRGLKDDPKFRMRKKEQLNQKIEELMRIYNEM